MQRWLSFSNHPFCLMLYLEWILLGITLLGQVRPAPGGMGRPDLPFSMLILVIFGVMGLKLPEKPAAKVLYTAIEFGLMLLSFSLDRRMAFFPLIGLIIVIRSCLIFQQLGRLVVAGSIFISFLWLLFQRVSLRPPPRHPGPFPPESFAHTILTLRLNTAITFGLALLFTLLLVNALLAERQSREQLLQANTQLRRYALRIEDQATLQERNRIAREIHDALGHTLTAQSIQLENAQLFLPPEAEKSATFLSEARQLGARALQEVRRSISTLRADPLQGQSLESAIAQAVDQFQQTTGVRPKYTFHLSQTLSTEISTALYRILQESLTNIVKHSQASEVSIHLQDQLGQVQLQIEDNGQGFRPEGNTTGFGLQGMRERTAALGGQFFLTSHPGQGCRTRVVIPLPRITL
ncbi:MAG TPA: sensor histidine kinase [Leptolyngbyaceae cyanobacterium]